MRRIFRLTILLGLIGGAVAAARRLVGPKAAPAEEAPGAAGPADVVSSDQPATTGGTAETPPAGAGGAEPEAESE